MKMTLNELRRYLYEACALSEEEPTASPVVDALSQLVAAPEEEAASDHFSAEVPVPEDYDATRDLLEQNPELVDLGISIVMDAAGTSCERSTAQGIIDHLQDMLGPGQEKAEVSLVGSLGESRYRSVIREQDTSKVKLEGELLADLTMTSDTISKIADEMYGLVMPDTPSDHHRRGGPTYGDELSDRLQAEVDKLDTLFDRLEIYFQSRDSQLPHAGVTSVDAQGNIAVAKGK